MKKVTFNLIPAVRYVDLNNENGDMWLIAARNRCYFTRRIQKIALVLNPILSRKHRFSVFIKSMDANNIFIDIQGFIVGGNFEPKELCVGYGDDKIYSFLFTPSTPFNKIDSYEKKSITWLEKNHHGLRYSDGIILQSKLGSIIRRCNSDGVIYVKDHQKKELLERFLPTSTIINLEHDLDCPVFAKCYHNCLYHDLNYSYCAIDNVKVLKKYINKI
jgi:hypothetical protein